LKLTVPRIFQYTSTDVVAQACLHDPLPIPLILALLAFPDLLLGSSKLRTAADAHSARDLLARKKKLERLFVVSARMYGFSMLALFYQRLDLVGTPQRPRAANVDVSFTLEVWDLEMAQHRQAVIIGVVVVPLIAIRVDKEDVVREGCVVINDIAGEGAC
jgi:hypothetical protein